MPCSEWAAVQLVERVRADPDGEKERRERSEQPGGVPLGRKRGADRDVAQVPERVRGVEEGRVVAPAAGGKRVERGPRSGAHDRRPQMTIPPPRLRRR